MLIFDNSIYLVGRGNRAIACSETVEASLRAKYGEPTDERLVPSKNGALMKKDLVLRWDAGPIVITYKADMRTGNRGSTWSATHEALPPQSIIRPDAASKL